jgi:hypothetical protein
MVILVGGASNIIPFRRPAPHLLSFILRILMELKFRGSKKAKLTQQPIELKRKNSS